MSIEEFEHWTLCEEQLCVCGHRGDRSRCEKQMQHFRGQASILLHAYMGRGKWKYIGQWWVRKVKEQGEKVKSKGLEGKHRIKRDTERLRYTQTETLGEREREGGKKWWNTQSNTCRQCKPDDGERCWKTNGGEEGSRKAKREMWESRGILMEIFLFCNLFSSVSGQKGIIQHGGDRSECMNLEKETDSLN